VVPAGAQQEIRHRQHEGTGRQEIVRKLAAGADIVIENFRPGALEKWGLGGIGWRS